MATGVYFSAGGTKKVSKIYFGAAGVAKKVTKGYIGGSDGKAKLFFSGGPESATLSKKTTLTLATARFSFGATSIGNYVLIAGGGISTNSDTNTNTVETFNKSLTRGTATALTFSPRDPAAVSNGTYAIITGGVNGDGYFYGTDSCRAGVAYNSSLTQTVLTSSQYVIGPGTSTTTFNNTALIFGGFHGYDDGEGTDLKVLYKINTKLTRTNQQLTMMGAYSAAASISNYAIFAGGGIPRNNTFIGEGGSTSGCALNSSFTSKSITLSIGRLWHTGGSVNNYALFAGGCYYNKSYNEVDATDTVDVFNTSLSRSSAAVLPYATSDGDLAASVYGHHIINNSGRIVAYNYSLTQSTLSSIMSSTEPQSCTAVLGNYAFIHAAGVDSYIKPNNRHNNSSSNKIEVYLSE